MQPQSFSELCVSSLSKVLDFGPWEQFKGKAVVDIGGNYGPVMAAVARKFPEAQPEAMWLKALTIGRGWTGSLVVVGEVHLSGPSRGY